MFIYTCVLKLEFGFKLNHTCTLLCLFTVNTFDLQFEFYQVKSFISFVLHLLERNGFE